MSNQHLKGFLIGALLGLGACSLSTDSTALEARGSNGGGGGQISGAIFTTLRDGSRVNANIYASKDDVYLDGGPGNNAPVGAAGLPAGDYYFQVTDPSGKTLLSQDDISCREFLVSDDGVIIRPVGPCPHVTGIDQDHAAEGAITIQLMPYADTPNPGGEYKVWATPVEDYDASATRFHGFVNRYSKTDNFKVRNEVSIPPPPPVCGDGHLDEGEQCDDGNTVSGDGCSADCKIETPPPPVCGDGHLDQGEECDDGNTVSGDGCSADCKIETPPPPLCGNGVVDEGEQCDDGNTVSGDGCSSTCQCEPS
jgi:cysteine-rich repeat protein